MENETMWIAVPADGEGPEAEVATCFGQAASHFVLLDAGGRAETRIISNPGFGAVCSGEECGGEDCPGILAARALKDTGVAAAIVRGIGKHAFDKLSEFGILVFKLEFPCTVGAAFDSFLSLGRPLDGPTVTFGRREEGK